MIIELPPKKRMLPVSFKCPGSVPIRLPLLLKAGVLLVAFGTAFPIYGSPSIAGYLRITFFRAGLIALLMALPVWKNSAIYVLRDFRIKCFLGFLILRILSLIMSPDVSSGIQQVFWFSEGMFCVISITACVRRYPKLLDYLVKCVLFFGIITAVVIVMQFLELTFKGSVSQLPLARGPFGIPEINFIHGHDKYGWYPLGVGYRIIGPFDDVNMAGTFMSYLFCFLLPSTIFKRGRKLPMLFPLTIFLFAILVSGSRQAFIAIILVLILFTKNVSKFKFAKAFLIVLISSGLLLWMGLWVKSRISMDVVLSNQYAGNVLARFVTNYQLWGKLDGGRLTRSKELINSLDSRVLFLGKGEGSGHRSAHNAFLIVLEENGALALIFLLLGTGSLFFISQKNIKIFARANIPQHWLHVAPLIALSWLAFLFMNWAQLNQNVSFVFLSFVLGLNLVLKDKRF